MGRIRIEVFKVLRDGRLKEVSYKELSDEGIQDVINAFKKANAHSEATLRGENWLRIPIIMEEAREVAVGEQ